MSAPEETSTPAAEANRARRGVMLIIASPSGAGKSTLSRLLLQTDGAITMSVSVTTRPRRPSEVDGVHYRFIAERDFLLMRERAELLEHAEVHGNLYGNGSEIWCYGKRHQLKMFVTLTRPSDATRIVKAQSIYLLHTESQGKEILIV